jgi:hypothetical protein
MEEPQAVGIEGLGTPRSTTAPDIEERMARELHPPLQLVPKSARAKDQHAAYMERYQTIRRQEVWKNCLSILVHGPGSRSERHRDLYNKRIEIVNWLRNPPREQDAKISEELVDGEDWRDQELAHAKASDLVLIVTGSSAPAAEFGDLINHDDVRPKTMAFIARSEERAYLGVTAIQKLGPARVLFFDYPGDLASCTLATNAIKTVEEHLLASIINRAKA